jgi:hypothetical protein
MIGISLCICVREHIFYLRARRGLANEMPFNSACQGFVADNRKRRCGSAPFNDRFAGLKRSVQSSSLKRPCKPGRENIHHPCFRGSIREARQREHPQPGSDVRCTVLLGLPQARKQSGADTGSSNATEEILPGTVQTELIELMRATVDST